HSVVTILDDESDTGWVEFPQSLFTNPKIIKHGSVLKVFVYLTLRAAFSEEIDNGSITQLIGEVLIDREQLRDALDLTPSEVSAAISALYKFGCLIKILVSEKERTFVEFLKNESDLVRIIENKESKKENNNKGLESEIDNYKNDFETAVRQQSDSAEITIGQYKNAKKDKKTRPIPYTKNSDRRSELDFSTWPNAPEPEIFISYSEMYLLKKGFEVSQTHIEQLAGNFAKMQSMHWSVNQCLLMMIEGGWTSISPSYQKVREASSVINKNNQLVESEFVAKGGENMPVGGSWLDKHLDRTWAEGL
ncbi:MAG: hypothetical protein OXE99_04830, partial [Cellvibrionales bacterium]|nr:hypothetical protein [Cellvibrionales bacterium]